jgi:MFS family permease
VGRVGVQITGDLRLLLGVDFLQKLVGTSFYTVFIASMYQLTGDTSDIGLISAATLLPALVVVTTSARYTARLSAKRTLTTLIWLRVLLFGGASALPLTVGGLLALAGLHSLIQQAVVSAKMTLDAELLSDRARRPYNAKKTMLANAAVIVGPPLGGLAASTVGLRVCLLAGASVSLVVLWLLTRLTTAVPAAVPGTSVNPHMSSARRHLLAQPDVLAMVATYCLVVVILEVEAPLTFPFVSEVFDQGADITGLLLGLCGLGGIAGAFAASRFPRVFADHALALLIIFDGLIFLAFTQSTNLILSAVLFTLLGCMGAVTIVIVEGAVQQRVVSTHRPTVFSLMQFAGGAGGASLGIVAAFIAARTGTRPVLAFCAVVEIAAGAGCFVLWKMLNRRRSETVSG